jgi:hypothetical protein
VDAQGQSNDRATSQVQPRGDARPGKHKRDDGMKHGARSARTSGEAASDDLAHCRSDSTQSATRSTRIGGQASKGIRWMPRLQEAKKDVVKLRKATVSR